MERPRWQPHEMLKQLSVIKRMQYQACYSNSLANPKLPIPLTQNQDPRYLKFLTQGRDTSSNWRGHATNLLLRTMVIDSEVAFFFFVKWLLVPLSGVSWDRVHNPCDPIGTNMKD